MTIHETVIGGLNDGEYQFLRVDIEGTRDRQLAQSGHHAGCFQNADAILNLSILKEMDKEVHYCK